MAGYVSFQLIVFLFLSVLTIYGFREFQPKEQGVRSSVLIVRRKNLRHLFYAAWFGVMTVLLVIISTSDLISPLLECYLLLEWFVVLGGFNSFYPPYVKAAKSEEKQEEKE